MKQKIRQLSIKVLQLYGGKTQPIVLTSTYEIFLDSSSSKLTLPASRCLFDLLLAVVFCFLLEKCLLILALGLCSYWYAEYIAFFRNVQ